MTIESQSHWRYRHQSEIDRGVNNRERRTKATEIKTTWHDQKPVLPLQQDMNTPAYLKKHDSDKKITFHENDTGL